LKVPDDKEDELKVTDGKEDELKAPVGELKVYDVKEDKLEVPDGKEDELKDTEGGEAIPCSTGQGEDDSEDPFGEGDVNSEDFESLLKEKKRTGYSLSS